MTKSRSGQPDGARRWPWYLVGSVLGIAAVVTGVLLAATHPSHHAHRHGTAYIVAFIAIAAVLVTAMVVWTLRRQFNQSSMQRLRRFSFSQRRTAMRAVKAGDNLTDEQREIAQAQFEQLGYAARRMRWALPAAVIAFISLAIANTGGWRWWWAALAGLELVATTGSLHLYRRQRRRLENALAVNQ